MTQKDIQSQINAATARLDSIRNSGLFTEAEIHKHSLECEAELDRLEALKNNLPNLQS